MEEADQLLMATLAHLGLKMPDEKANIGALGPESIVQGVLLCLYSIDPASRERFPEAKMPTGMSARFNFGAKLAQEVQGLGFSGEIGYQSFLYPSEREVRSLLLFLTEKLPRVEEETVGGIEQPIALARRKIGQAIRQKLDAKKVSRTKEQLTCEPFCGCLVCYPAEQVVGWSMGRETRNACLSSSLIETNALLRTSRQQHELSSVVSPVQLAAAATEVTAAETEQQSLVESGNDGLPGNLPTSLLLQPTGKVSTQNEAGTTEPDKSKLSEADADKKDEQNSKSALKQEREKLQAEVDSLKERMSQRKEERTQIASNRERQMSRKTTAIARVTESQAGLEKHRKILGLLPEGEANHARLLGIVQKSQGRLLGLKEQWTEHRAGLEKERGELEEALTIASRLAEKGKSRGQPSVEEQLGKVSHQLEAAGKEHKRLVRVVEGLRAGESREGHTQRILAIMRQLEKLQTGVDTVITDVKGVQKDINMLNGKLERSFFEICMAMKAKIRNKEPYVEHSMGLLRLAYPFVYIMCYITFALISLNASFNFPQMWQKCSFWNKYIPIYRCWLLNVDSARDTS